jgi:hypothetical protein
VRVDGTGRAVRACMPAPIVAALLLAQAAPPSTEPQGIALHGWADVFYGLNFNRPADGASFLPGTGTTAKRANEVNLNAAALDASLDPGPVGFHLTVAVGSGTDVLHAGEPTAPATGLEIWRAVYQASVSYKAPVGRGLLLEAGIYPSHIGYESFFSKDNGNYTRSWMGDFSPYYQAGLKIAYPFDDHWSAQIHFLNGWQIIGDNNHAKAVGTQVAWTNDSVSLAFNTFAGPELPGDDSHWRLFGDLVAQWKASGWLALGASADVGRQDRPGGAAVWDGAALYARFALHPKAALALRAEYYDDRDGFFSGTPQLLVEGTATLELRPADHLIFKLEARQDVSDARVFQGTLDATGTATTSKAQTLVLASANASF